MKVNTKRYFKNKRKGKEVLDKLCLGFRELLKGVIQTKIDAGTSYYYNLTVDDKEYFVELKITPQEDFESA